VLCEAAVRATVAVSQSVHRLQNLREERPPYGTPPPPQTAIGGPSGRHRAGSVYGRDDVAGIAR